MDFRLATFGLKIPFGEASTVWPPDSSKIKVSSVEFQNVEENLRHSFRALAEDRRSGDVREIGGVAIASAGTSFQMFNAAFLSSPVADAADLERRTLIARVQFESRGLEWSFWVCEDLLPPRLRKQAERILNRCGLRLAEPLRRDRR